MEAKDQTYLRVCEKFKTDGQNLTLAILGDSHAKRLYAKVQDEVENQEVQKFLLRATCAVGGARAGEFVESQSLMFNSLCSEDDISDIVIIWIGGNDLDEDLRNIDIQDKHAWNRHLHNRALRGVLDLFVRLTKAGKIVYVIMLPERYSTRNVKLQASLQNTTTRVEVYRDSCKRFNSFLRRVLDTRVIVLPRRLNLNVKEAFEGVFHPYFGKEYVHLREQHYTAMADVVLSYIKNDLDGKKSMPENFKLQELLNRYQ